MVALMTQNKLTCVYCGQSPVPHRLTWFNESLMVIFTPLNRWMTRRWFYSLADRVVSAGLIYFARLLHQIQVIKFNSDIKQLNIARAKALWSDAAERGITMQSALFLGRQVDFYRAKLPGQKWMYFNGLPRPGINGPALAWMDDKAILKEKLAGAGIAVPTGASCTTYEEAYEVLKQLGRPVIVKPRLGSRGRHSFTNISAESELRKAFFLAKQLCNWVMVEEFLPGTLYRGTIIGGRLVGVMGWGAPSVKGNGISTIEELITKKNNETVAGVAKVLVNQQLVDHIANFGLALNSVLENGQEVSLGLKIGPAYGGTSFEITDIIHPEIKKILERAGQVVDDPIIGFDFIIEDPTKDPQNQRWGIIEANALPFIHFHHYPVQGKPNNVARHIWDLFLPRKEA